MSTPRTRGSHTPRRAGSSAAKADGEPELIVARGLQEMLERERSKGRPETLGTPRGASAGTKKRKAAARPPGVAPNFVICYLCGRQFGSASIGIHRPQCYLKKMIEWERADPATRGAAPQDPETHEKKMQEIMKGGGGGGGGGAAGASAPAGGKGMSRKAAMEAEAERRNLAEFEAYNANLAPCPNCGRTFLPDRLVVHLKSCKPGAAAKPVARRNPPPSASASAVSASAAAATTPPPPPAEERPIRASGQYRLPEGATEDSAPPGAAPARPRRVSFKDDAAAPAAAAAINDEEEGEEAEESLGRSERRLSTHATAAAESDAPPSRPSRDPVLAPGSSATSASAPRDSDSATGDEDDEDEEGGVPPPLPPRNSGSPAPPPAAAAAGPQRHADPNAAAAAPQPPEEAPRKKIALNNVSRFKHVQSRLKQEMQQQQQKQESSLAGCRYCGRTFNPDRLARHEECCVERHKAPPPPAPARGKKAMPKTTKRPATVPTAGAAAAAPAPAPAPKHASNSPVPKFCAECGSGITPGAKFCASCGHKL